MSGDQQQGTPHGAPPDDLRERVARNEASINHLERDVTAIGDDLRRIETKADRHHAELSANVRDSHEELMGYVRQVGQGQRKIVWLLIGGWAAMTTLGALLLWFVNMGEGIVRILSGG